MPSKSKAQHNLMAMVANNPAAAKRLGIPQSVGKEFMKADKRKMKKYGLGGPTSYSGEDTDEGMKMSTRRGSTGTSFKEAFAAARKAGKEKFEWFNPKKGKMESFTTELEKKSAKAESPKAESPKEVKVTKTETSVEAPAVSGSRRGPGGRGASLPEGYRPKVGSGRYDDPTSSYGERVMSPLSRLGDMFGLRREEDLMKRMGVDREEARKRLANLDRIKESEGMKRGGKVGSGRSEMKESKAMMRKEVAFMKKKGAPKSMIKHEQAEYGMKRGGMAGSYRKAADGIAHKGKTKGHVVKMREGGSVGSFRHAADGIASKGKTKGKMVKMNYGGKC